MNKRYFRLKESAHNANQTDWIEMTGKEFYRFIHSPEGEERHFIDMGDVMLEVAEADGRQYRTEQNHHYYVLGQEEGWNTLSLYEIENGSGCSGEEAIPDNAQDVETEAMMRLEYSALYAALAQLDWESRRLIYMLYLADEIKTIRRLSSESGIPVMTLQDRKKKALAILRQILS